MLYLPFKIQGTVQPVYPYGPYCDIPFHSYQFEEKTHFIILISAGCRFSAQ